ncbi:MAG: ATP-binding protein, partial [Bacteroidota bacterium]
QIEYVYTFFKPEAETKGIKLSFENPLPAKEAIIKTDREKLYAILANLVNNALKYTEKGSIELGYETLDTRGRAYLRFYIKDTGIGIPEDRQGAIFDRFIQADIADRMAYQGAGLGLAISKSYVEMLGGDIWVESEEGKGSTFYFTIPYKMDHQETDAQNVDESAIEKEDQAKSLKVLIVEDDELSAMLLSEYLQAIGKEILQISSGTEAVKICKNHPDIDLILMDIKMPDMDGEEVTREIRKFNKDVVIIAQTACGLSGDRKKAIEAGCDDYLAKPLIKTQLQTLIKKYFVKG